MALSDLSLEHKTVSVVGKMDIPPSAPGIVKLIVEKLVSHDYIAKRAFETYKSGRGGSADWSISSKREQTPSEFSSGLQRQHG